MHTTAKLKPSKEVAKTPTWRYVTSSVMVWLVLALVAIDFAICTFRPLKHVKAIQYLPLDQNPVVSKIPEFFDSSIKPDALVLGSSLPMTAIAYCDYQYAGEPDATKIGQVRVYTKAHYLQDHLNRLLKEPINVFNLSCYGCMASEAYLLLSRAIDDNRKPAYVFYGIAPRDFVDNSVPAIGQTPVYEVLADWRCVNDIFSRNLNPIEIGDLCIRRLWYYYRVKADYRTLLTALSCDFLNHPATLYQASQQVTAKEEIAVPHAGSICTALEAKPDSASKRFNDNLTEYKSRYNPANFQRYAEELSYFQKLTKLCQDKNVKLIVFNMPLMDSNKRLLDTKLYQNYLTDTAKATKQSGGTYIDLDTPGVYSQNDFIDSAHLNATGGKKLQDNLLKQLSAALSGSKPE